MVQQFSGIFLVEDNDRLSCMVNAMAADDLATQGARESEAMVSLQLFWNITVSAPEGLTHWNLVKMDDIWHTVFSNAFSLNKTFVFWLKFHRRFFSGGQMDNKSALVHLMIWRQTVDKPFLEPMPPHFTDEFMRHHTSRR